MKIKELISEGQHFLSKNAIEDAGIKARILLQYVLQQTKGYLIINSENEVKHQEEIQYKQYLQELLQGKPIQYITNHVEFMGLDFYVDENVLIPQPDTEVLVEETIKEIEKIRANKPKATIRILDLCTGSGAIIISIAKHFKLQEENNIEYYAIDISQEAIEVANKNMISNEVKVHYILSDMFRNIEEAEKEKFDIIVSNPPYIETETINQLAKEVQAEPHLALDGGKDGLDFYKIIAKESKNYLNNNGKILLEIGYNQKSTVTNIFEEEYEQIDCIKDLANNDRVIKVSGWGQAKKQTKVAQN